MRKRVYNVRTQGAMHDVLKKIGKSVTTGKKAEAEALLKDAYQVIDKAAKRGILKPNTAARKKSRLVAAIKKLS